MDKLEQTINNLNILYGFCKPSDIPYGKYINAFAKRKTANPLDIMMDTKTIITLAKPIELSEDIYRSSYFYNSYPGYGKIFEYTEMVVRELKKNGFKAKFARNLDQKSSAIACGIGVRGKNTLVINKEFGTRLRLDTIVTNYIPGDYSTRVKGDLCSNCEECIRNLRLHI